jgi:hypothetical protein
MAKVTEEDPIRVAATQHRVSLHGEHSAQLIPPQSSGTDTVDGSWRFSAVRQCGGGAERGRIIEWSDGEL